MDLISPSSDISLDLLNPLATILSGAMMLRIALNMPEAALDIENAVSKVLSEGYRTGDIFTEGTKKVGTNRPDNLDIQKAQEFGKLIREKLENQ